MKRIGGLFEGAVPLALTLGLLTLGMLVTAWYAMAPGQEPQFDVGVTLSVGMPVALSVLFYMLRLKKRAVLA